MAQAAIRVFCGPCHDSGGCSSVLWPVPWLRRLFECFVARAMTQEVVRVFCGPCHDSEGYSSVLWPVQWLRQIFESSVARAMTQEVVRVFCGPCHGSGGYSSLLWPVPWLRQLFASLSQRVPLFSPKSNHAVLFGGQGGTGTSFSPNTSAFPCQHHSTTAPYSLHFTSIHLSVTDAI
jgi:hypothetical protein